MCSVAKDCKPMTCDKYMSEMICTNDRGCACTLPSQHNLKWHSLVFIICVTVGLLIWMFMCDSEKEEKRYVTSKPYFIKSATFTGAKRGYVFKTENGQTGFYLDVP